MRQHSKTSAEQDWVYPVNTLPKMELCTYYFFVHRLKDRHLSDRVFIDGNVVAEENVICFLKTLDHFGKWNDFAAGYFENFRLCKCQGASKEQGWQDQTQSMQELLGILTLLAFGVTKPYCQLFQASSGHLT